MTIQTDHPADTLTPSGGTLTVSGITQVIGSLKLPGSSSGVVTIQPAAAAGTYTLTLPITDGNTSEFLQTDGSGALTWAAAGGSGTVTSVGFTGGIVSVADPTTTPAFTVAGTSGGIPYFASGTTWATSAALAASALVVGGGAGAAPATVTTGTGILTALAANVGSAGAPVTFNGALGTPSSGTVTNLTGTASININGTVGATTPGTGAFTTISASASISGSAAQGAIYYGTLGYSDTNIIVSGQTSANSYLQWVIQNTSAGATASTNYNVSNDQGTATTHYGEFGINSSGFTGSGAFNAAGAVYLTATTGDLAIGTTTSNAIHFVVNGGATDAATISSAGLLTANSFGSSSAAITGGSINATPVGATTASTGAFTALTLTGVTGLSGAIGTAIADYFTSTISLAASSTYAIECEAYFLKTTAGTVIWTWAFSSAPTMSSSFYTATPITGFTTTTITGAPVSGEAHVQAAPTMAHAASGSLTTAVYHSFRFTVTIRTNAATTIQLRATESAGTITPQAGSYMRATKVL